MEEGITKMASCIFMTYLLVTLGSAAVVSAVENVPIITAMFETVSAMATVGLSFGITPYVGMAVKLIIILLMICGRVGSVTILLAFSSDHSESSSKLPLEKISVG